MKTTTELYSSISGFTANGKPPGNPWYKTQVAQDIFFHHKGHKEYTRVSLDNYSPCPLFPLWFISHMRVTIYKLVVYS